MKTLKHLFFAIALLISLNAIAQDFTPYYFDNEYNNYKRKSKTNFVDGDFNYSFTDKLKNYGAHWVFYHDIIYSSYTKDSLLCTVENKPNEIIIRYFDADMNLVKEYGKISKNQRKLKKTSLEVFIREDTIFHISSFKNTEHDKYYLFCESYSLLDGSYNNDLKKIGESHYQIESIYKTKFIISENQNYFAFFIERNNLYQISANKSEYILLDRNFNLVLHKDSIIDAVEFFDKYPSMYVKNFWQDENFGLWMQDIRLNDNGELSFFCFSQDFKYCTEKFDYFFIHSNLERTLPINYCFVLVSKDDTSKNNEILVSLTVKEIIQDLEYEFIGKDSILFTAFYLTLEPYTHNIASFVASLKDKKATEISNKTFSDSFKYLYFTEAEIKAEKTNALGRISKYGMIYKSEGMLSVNGGYVNIYSRYSVAGIFGAGSELIYNFDYYLMYYSKSGECLGSYKIPQRRLHYFEPPKLLTSVIDGNIYIVFADGRLKIHNKLVNIARNLDKYPRCFSQFVIYKIDESFNISQYICPIDKKDFEYVYLEKDLWLSDTEIIGSGCSNWWAKHKIIKIDFFELINAE